jgi:hypothetical protein
MIWGCMAIAVVWVIGSVLVMFFFRGAKSQDDEDR